MMTGPRKRNATQEEMLGRIRRAAQEERNMRVLAEAEARELIARRIAEARSKTNALLYAAYYTAGLTKAAITADGLGTTNRQAADQRIREYMAEGDVEQAQTFMEQAQLAVRDTSLRVELHEGSVWVILDDFTHDDVGSGLRGEVRYTATGTALGIINPNDALVAAYDNPFMPGLLWDLDEVQEATK